MQKPLKEFLSQSITLWNNNQMTEMYEVSMTSAWQCILTLLLIAYPSSHMDPQSKCDKEEIFDTYGTYHPCQSWWFKEHHPNDLISLWWLNSSDFPFGEMKHQNDQFLEWCNHAVNKWIDHPCTTLVLWLSTNWDLGSKWCNITITFHKLSQIITW